MTLIVDASVAVEYLLRTPLGQRVAPRVENADLMAPALLDAEVLSVLRRIFLAGRLTAIRARAALDDLAAWEVRRLPHRPLLEEAWALRHAVSSYDALYLAAGRLHEAPVLTADGPLARARATGVVIENVRG